MLGHHERYFVSADFWKLVVSAPDIERYLFMNQSMQRRPYIADKKVIPELTLVPILVGILLGIIFGASSLYLALKIGMTVSASIPVAVLSITVFRGFSKVFKSRPATILENNIVQTTGSAGESIAFGVAVTMPAMLIWGYNIEIGITTLVALLGGLLGVLMMIPLRHALIVEGHDTLKYPEGTACADVLIVGEEGGMSAKTVFSGFFLGLFYKVANLYLRMWKETAEKAIVSFKGAVATMDVAPELLGVGYIIGFRVSAIMVAGGVLSSFVLIPAIALFGESQTVPLFPAVKLIKDMSAVEIWKNYILYIGAGAVAAGGIFSMIQSMPTIWRSLKEGLHGYKSSGKSAVKRTERDLPMSLVLAGCILLVAIIMAVPALKMNLFGALLIVFFGFLFVTVSSRITGELGSSSNPISGMTVATLLITSLIFLGLGWTQGDYRVTALAVAAIVCIAASNGGTTSQDLKTGYLVGATPRAQQIAIVAGSLSSALVMGYVLILLNDASTVYTTHGLPQSSVALSQLKEKESLRGPDARRDPGRYFTYFQSETAAGIPAGKYLVDDQGHFKYFIDPGINGALTQRDDGTPVVKYQAPKARLMSLIIDGILTQKLPLSLVLLGVFIAVVLELCSISALPFAVGVYLPLSASSPIFIGGLVRWFVERGSKKKGNEIESETTPGVLLCSGLIAGGSIAGILYAIVAQFPDLEAKLDLSSFMGRLAESDGFAVLVFGAMAVFVYLVGKEKLLKSK
jgi:putative OPT family oligopeptide transporter